MRVVELKVLVDLLALGLYAKVFIRRFVFLFIFVCVGCVVVGYLFSLFAFFFLLITCGYCFVFVVFILLLLVYLFVGLAVSLNVGRFVLFGVLLVLQIRLSDFGLGCLLGFVFV